MNKEEIAFNNFVATNNAINERLKVYFLDEDNRKALKVYKEGMEESLRIYRESKVI